MRHLHDSFDTRHATGLVPPVLVDLPTRVCVRVIRMCLCVRCEGVSCVCVCVWRFVDVYFCFLACFFRSLERAWSKQKLGEGFSGNRFVLSSRFKYDDTTRGMKCSFYTCEKRDGNTHPNTPNTLLLYVHMSFSFVAFLGGKIKYDENDRWPS